MNEFFAIEPTGFGNARELKRILDQFGPYRGRYIAEYPVSWLGMVKESTRDWPDIEQQRVRSLLAKLKSQAGLIRQPNLSFKKEKSWPENVIERQKVVQPPPFTQAVIAGDPPTSFFIKAEDFDPPVTMDQIILATPAEYARVSAAILTISREIILIDPYLDLGKNSHREIINALMTAAGAGEGKCSRMVIFTRKAEVTNSDVCRVEAARLLKNVRGPVKELVVHLCDDKGEKNKLHARYLLSIRGALRFDMGFQRMNRMFDVSVVGKMVHDELIKTFIDNPFPFEVIETVKAC